MKTRLLGNFSPSPLVWSICFVLFLTASGCASSIPITPSETTDAVSNVSIEKGDHALINAKDDREVEMVVTEINSKRKILIGRPISQPKSSYYKPIAIYFSDITSIEIRQSNTPNSDDDLDDLGKVSYIPTLPYTFGELMKGMAVSIFVPHY